jgi:heavy metal translocating P-type ATPase
MRSMIVEAVADKRVAPFPTPLLARLWRGRDVLTAALALSGILLYLTIRYMTGPSEAAELPLLVALGVGGALLVAELLWQAAHAHFGSDQLAGVSIVTSVLLGEYLAGAIIVLMLAGGETLQRFAIGRATSALHALASRVPTIAHRNRRQAFEDVAVDEIRVGDELTILPHEFCPVDGEVIQGHGAMDESYLTGEPFTIPKGPGSQVLSGALNAESVLVVRAVRVAADSRYAQIMRVMQEAEQRRPALRRIGDQIGAWYTPLALAIALIAWWWSGNAVRFLSVVVIATPCPVLIGIPVAIIGAVSTAARRGIIVKDPAALEQLTLCRTMIFDKTGTLTYGRPTLSEDLYAPPFTRETLLPVVAAIERYSRHPIAGALLDAANRCGFALPAVDWTREEPGVGLRARVGEWTVLITGRRYAPSDCTLPPAASTGLETIVVVNGGYAATYRFVDVARADSRTFVGHLEPTHGFTRVLLVSGDREAEVDRLAKAVSIDRVYAEQSPEQKVAIVRRETDVAKTVFIGDGINDAPALLTATVGIAFGRNSDVTTAAARVVIIDSSLSKVDTLMHVSYRLRRVALQSAIGGMLLSTFGMAFAAVGLLQPAAGAVVQELIDLAAVLNALRTAAPISSDFNE